MGHKKIEFPVSLPRDARKSNTQFSPKKYLSNKAVFEAIEQMFAHLPCLYQFVLLMAYLEELETEDISFVLDVSEPAAERLITKAKRCMLQEIQAYTNDDAILSQFPKMISKPVLGQYFKEDLEKISESDVNRILNNIEF